MAKLLTRAGGSLLGGNRIEVYEDRLVIGGLLNRTEIRLADITSVGLSGARGLPGLGGRLDLFVRGRPNPIYVPFTHRHEREYYEAKSTIDRLIFGTQRNYAMNVGRLFTNNELLGGVIDLAVNELLKEFNLTSVPEDKTVIVNDGEVTRPAEPAPVPEPGVTPEMAELEKWAACRDKGMITEDEYQFKKKQLLYRTRDSDGNVQKLIPCEYCGTIYDAGANAKCPSCGAPLKMN